MLQPGVINEGEGRRAVFEKVIERVKHGHFRDQFDLDAKLLQLVRENESRIPVREGVLLPVDEVLATRDLPTGTLNLGPPMWRRPQSHHVRPMPDGLAIS